MQGKKSTIVGGSSDISLRDATARLLVMSSASSDEWAAYYKKLQEHQQQVQQYQQAQADYAAHYQQYQGYGYQGYGYSATPKLAGCEAFGTANSTCSSPGQGCVSRTRRRYTPSMPFLWKESVRWPLLGFLEEPRIVKRKRRYPGTPLDHTMKEI